MSHSISPLHPTRFSVRFFVRWMILLLVATIAIDASAQSQRRKKKRSWKEKVEYADSIRLEIRRASDEGRLLQWATVSCGLDATAGAWTRRNTTPCASDW